MSERFLVAVHILLLCLKMGELYGLLEEETMVCKKLFIDSVGLVFLRFKKMYFSVIYAYYRKTLTMSRNFRNLNELIQQMLL